MEDPYKTLGVEPGSSEEEIKSAYRAMAKKYHPDLHPGDEYAAKKMNEINEAYDKIKNPQSYTNQRTSYSDPFSQYGGQDPFRSYWNGNQQSGGGYSTANGFQQGNFSFHTYTINPGKIFLRFILIYIIVNLIINLFFGFGASRKLDRGGTEDAPYTQEEEVLREDYPYYYYWGNENDLYEHGRHWR